MEDQGIDPGTGERRWSTWGLEPGIWEVTVDPGDGGDPIEKAIAVLPGSDSEVSLP